MRSTNLGTLEASRGNLPAAIAYLERATASARGAGVPNLFATYNLGLAEVDTGRWHAATTTLASAHATAEREAPGDSVYLGEVDIWLGAAHLALGEIDQAHALIERGLGKSRAASSAALVEPLALSALSALARHDLVTAKARLAEIEKRGDGAVSLALLARAELTRQERGCREARPHYERALAAVKKDSSPLVKSAATVGLGECLHRDWPARRGGGAPRAARRMAERRRRRAGGARRREARVGARAHAPREVVRAHTD